MKQRYDSYKPSGIDWIGDIPSHWNVLPLKRVCTMFGRIGYRGYTIQDLRAEGEGAITLSPSNMVNGGMDFGSVSYLSWEKYHESPEIKIQEGDILFVKTGSTFGKTSYVKGLPMEATINPQILRIVPKTHKKFLAYCMGTPYSQALTDCYVVGSTIPTISQESIGRFMFPVPPLAEQEEIAAWLDEKCGEIDAAVAKVDREIELIDELKQSEISRAVTRGLNPDAPLRSSGIDWIGDIPSHWKVCKLNRLLDGIQDGTHATLQRVDDGHPLLSAKNVFEDGIHISENESCISTLDYNEIISNGYPKKGDIALCCVATIGRGCIYSFDYPLAFQRSVTFLRINSHYSNSFVLYYLRSVSAKAQFDTYAKTSAQSGVYMGDLKRFFICLPPLSEQQEIADYLDKKCAEIDGLKAKLTKKRETLTELRQSIISEVVTGKRKVI